MDRTALYRTLWRWHFYAGLFVLPFILILSLTGALYLFKPQIDRFEERAFRDLPTTGSVYANQQLDAALAAFPAASLKSYRLPIADGDAALIQLADGETLRDVFVSPQGRVMGSLTHENRIAEFDSTIHGELLAGRWGSWLVELVGSWAIVMIISGLYLWWPRGRGMAGTLWPRRGSFVRDLHAVTGFWTSAFALVLLITALPWAGVWGDAFKTVRTELGLVKGKQDWKIGGGHDHSKMVAMEQRGIGGIPLAAIIGKARAENLAFPVLIEPPGEEMVWTVKSDAQNRPLRATITYDMMTGKELSRARFADKHPIDRAVGYGIAWHEGQLFGWVNQLIGLLTAMALVTMVVSGFILWRRRKPESGLGAPPALRQPAHLGGVAIILLVLAALLPLLAASLILLWLFERVALPHLPRVAHWLGVTANA